MEPLCIESVQTEADQHAFMRLPWRVYDGDPYWVPPFFSEMMALMDEEHHPFYEHAEVAFFLARRGEEVVGRIAAFTNHRHNEFQGENIGFFGFFEVLDDPEAAQALLDRAETWVRDRGHEAIRGPAQFSTNEECGLLVDGFGDLPRIFMTYNPPRYIDLIENAGFEKAMDLWAWAVRTDIFESGKKFPKKLVRVVKKVEKRGKINIRTMRMGDFDAELEMVKQLYNTCWAKNWGFVPLTDAEIDKLGKELRPLLDPDLVLVAEIDGQPVGFSLTLWDLNQPLHAAYPHPDEPELWTKIKFAWQWKVRSRTNWVRVFTLGVLPEHRGRGIDALFYYYTAVEALRKGIEFAEMSWILENNDMMNRGIELMGAEVYKTYRFYEKKL
jgi:GNAT superfamily N-acetyltransferase